MVRLAMIPGTLQLSLIHIYSERRYQNTAVQSALHLLDGYFEAKGLYLSSVGVNPENQWFEVNSKEVNEEMLDAVEKFMNEAIHQEIPCQITYMKGSEYPDVAYHQFEELRLVRFGEINTQPCGTLHVHHTGQIESFTILDHEKTSKGTRAVSYTHLITTSIVFAFAFLS